MKWTSLSNKIIINANFPFIRCTPFRPKPYKLLYLTFHKKSPGYQTNQFALANEKLIENRTGSISAQSHRDKKNRPPKRRCSIQKVPPSATYQVVPGVRAAPRRRRPRTARRLSTSSGLARPCRLGHPANQREKSQSLLGWPEMKEIFLRRAVFPAT